MAKKNVLKRFLVVDLIRAVSLVLMLIYHWFFLLYYLELLPYPNQPTLFESVGWIARVGFIGSVGAVIWIRTQLLHHSKIKLLFRATQILVAALLISLGSLLAVGELWVRFGVLHLIGISIILTLPLTSFPKVLGLSGLALLALHVVAPLPAPFSTLDYFPLIPWLGVVWLGYFSTSVLLPKKSKPRHITQPLLLYISWINKHALTIYVVHGPLFVATLWLLLGWSL